MSADAEELAGQVLEQTASDEAVTALEKLTCVGRELSSRRERCSAAIFRNRRSLGAFAGLTPSPYQQWPAAA